VKRQHKHGKTDPSSLQPKSSSIRRGRQRLGNRHRRYLQINQGHTRLSDASEQLSRAERELTLDLLFCELVSIIGRYSVQEIDIFVGMELGHFSLRSWLRALEV
jgi:hypothetical protein